MSREFKFRAWDKQNECMRYDNILHLGFNADFLEWMQYTGLKDKNGKEIYEGDVVKSNAWNPETYQVIFEDGSFGFKNTGDNYLNSLHYLEKFEVIGNIYENPSLITGGL